MAGIALAVHKKTGIPFAEDVEIAADLPHTLSYLVMYVSKIDSFNELTDDKKPPRGIWDKPYKLKEFFDEVFKTDSKDKNTTTIEFDPEEVE